jgi:hypothetical protein
LGGNNSYSLEIPLLVICADPRLAPRFASLESWRGGVSLCPDAETGRLGPDDFKRWREL